MNEHTVSTGQGALEERSRALFHESVDGLDMRTRSRLTQARYAALEAAERSKRSSWLPRGALWKPAAGVTAAAVLAIGLWVGAPSHQHAFGPHAGASADSAATLEDLDIVAASDGNSGDAMEMLQDDVEFYDWAEKTGSSEPAA